MTIYAQLSGQRKYRQKTGFEEAQHKVLSYARCIEDVAPMPGRVVDEMRLPYPKAELKEALLICIDNIPDGRLADELRAGYMLLPAFQPGVGECTLGTDLSRIDLEADPLTVAAQIERESEMVRRWKPVIEAELESARQDLFSN